jgi:hypothetical protein
MLADVEITALLVLKENRKRSRKYWIHPINYNRLNMNQFHLLHGKLREHPEKFFNFYRISIKSFDKVISLVGDHLREEGNGRGDGTGSEERLREALPTASRTQ